MPLIQGHYFFPKSPKLLATLQNGRQKKGRIIKKMCKEIVCHASVHFIFALERPQTRLITHYGLAHDRPTQVAKLATCTAVLVVKRHGYQNGPRVLYAF